MPKSSAIDPYLGYYEAMSCHWSCAGLRKKNKGLKYYWLKRVERFQWSHLVLRGGQYLQAPQEGHSHMQACTVAASSGSSHTHTYIYILYILVKGCLQNQQIAPLTLLGKLIFLSLPLSSFLFFFFPGRCWAGF